MTGNEADAGDLRERLAGAELELAKHKRVLNIATELGRHVEFEVLLPMIIARVTEVMEADRTSLFLFDQQKRELWTMVGEGLESMEIRIPVEKGLAGLVAETGKRINIDDAYTHARFDRTWDRKTGYRTRSVLCMPLWRKHNEILGVIQVLNKKSAPRFNVEDEDFLELLCTQIAVFIENADLYRRIERLFESVVDAISIALDARDPVTAGHSLRVTQYAVQIARAIHAQKEGLFAGVSFSLAELRELRYAGLLHDFGKVAVPEAILQKSERLPANWIHVIAERLRRCQYESVIDLRARRREPREAGEAVRSVSQCLGFLINLNRAGFLADEARDRLHALHDKGLINDLELDHLAIPRGTLTSEERAVIESHVEKTSAFLSAIPWPAEMAGIPAIASGHHEAQDGSGYPGHLKGEEIPLGARILAVADIYDALTAQDRPYKPAIPHERSAKILQDMAGEGKLQPEIVDLFLRKRLYNLSESDTVRLQRAKVVAARAHASGRES
jgi:HD-GYP domain-containing protein (c-di-GMP phosphodiesterase class II)